ncbi:PQQ-dependent sugar dehydrogenase [Dokdonella sp. MW10]|uniref:PQQ-dependent sugar dehydrogenase n=1 Tax=Dokdonella sp. MW10 TaxID=2992926 RepID=UPI003F7F1939
MRMTLLAAALLAGTAPMAMAQTAPSDLTLVTFATGTGAPVAIRAPHDGSGRVFIVNQSGTVRVVKNGTLLTTPFVSVPVTSGGESGLLGLAFHPNFGKVGLPHNDEFYVAYNRAGSEPRLGSSPDVALARYTVPSLDSDTANPAGTVVLRVPDNASNHNGGDIHFGPDGYLYMATGDGGSQGDPHGFAMCLWKKALDSTPANCGTGTPTYFLMGKILRLDVDTRGGAVTADMCGSSGISPAQYAIPSDNPHVATGNTCDETWLHGFRNPWRTSFDRETGDFWIGDVGQNNVEEINLRVAGSTEPTFYGWRCLEGSATYNSANVCAPPVAPNVLPVLEYTHTNSRCAVTGGFRFRGPIGPLRGMYVYADSCTSEIWFAKPGTGGAWTTSIWRDDANGYGTYSGFGEDEAGNLYVAHTSSGTVYRFASERIFTSGFDD